MKKSLIAFFSLYVAMSSAHASAPQVMLDTGRIEGLQIEGVETFKGIPYAKAPVGELRWQPPQPFQHWPGIRAAREYGPDCLQEPFPGNAAPTGSAGYSEDCLTLNIWRPVGQNGPLPVMVWIHGGGFVNGGSSPQAFSGAAFARRGVVLVSINYRLGRFGFFAHPALADQPLRGNYGLLDQIAALQWVQRNIAAFNGDASNVTLFGESAGGFSVHSLLTTDLSYGLFHKAIIQSGSGRYNLTPHQGWQKAQQVGEIFARMHGITDVGAKGLAQLRQLPAQKVVSGLNMANMFSPSYAGPMVDGRIIRDEPQTLYRQGKFHRIPLIVGATDEDLGFAPPVKTFAAAVQDFTPKNRIKARSLYQEQAVDPQRMAQMIARDRFMIEPARFVAKIWQQFALPAWHYRFAYVAESMSQEWPLGAPHASEVPFIFNTLDVRYGAAVTERDRAMAHQIQSYWVNFARNGKPTEPGLPHWDNYLAQRDNLLIFSGAGAPKTTQQRDPRQPQLDVIATLAE